MVCGDGGDLAAASAALQQEPGPLRKGGAICALERELLSASGAAAGAPADRQLVFDQAVQPQGLVDPGLMRAMPWPAAERPSAPAASARRVASGDRQFGQDEGSGDAHRARAAGRLGGGSAPIARYLGVQPPPVQADARRDHTGSHEGSAWGRAGPGTQRRDQASTRVDRAWGEQAGSGRRRGGEAGVTPRSADSAWAEQAGPTMRRASPDQVPAHAGAPPVGEVRAAPLRPRRLGRSQAGPVAHALAKPESEQTVEYRRKASISAYFGGGTSVPARGERVRPGELSDAATPAAAAEQGWADGYCSNGAAVAEQVREVQGARPGASIFGSYKAPPFARV